MRLRVLLAGDDAPARAELGALIQSEPDLELVGECTSALHALLAMLRSSPDLLFLDAQTPGFDRADLLAWTSGARPVPAVILVGRCEEAMLRDLEGTGALYLLTPVEPDKLRRAVARSRARLAVSTSLSASASPGVGEYPERFLVNTARGLSFVHVHDIDWIESAGNYLQLRVGGQAFLIRQTMTAVERLLDPRRFARIHRCAVVNLERIEELLTHRARGLRVRLSDGSVLAVSRTFRQRLGAILGAHRRPLQSSAPAATGLRPVTTQPSSVIAGSRRLAGLS